MPTVSDLFSDEGVVQLIVDCDGQATIYLYFDKPEDYDAFRDALKPRDQIAELSTRQECPLCKAEVVF